MKTEKIASTMSAALLAVAGGGIVREETMSASTTDTSPPSSQMFRDAQVSKTGNLFSAAATASYAGSTRFTTQIKARHGWEESEEHEFSQLVIKEAVDHLSETELNRLTNLQNKRRTTKSPEPADLILLRYRREKLDRELLELLSRYVYVPENATNPA